ncbi:MAG TPA: molybdopterin molybdotransferase MoeA [Firmicutes bacterium]|nr:molybdopterin molybdotransferase MoeA [Bacillota bacterium]
MNKQQAFSVGREGLIRLMLSRVSFNSQTEVVPLSNSLGRVTAKDIFAQNTLPNSPASSMDGIAVRFDDFQGNVPDTGTWCEGDQYLFSNTGVAIDGDYDTVILIEDVQFDSEGRLTVLAPPKEKGQNIIHCGRIMKQGDLLIPAHFFLGPGQLGLLASGGISMVPVITRPKVAIIPTGNELVPPGVPLPKGKNVESNGVMINGFVECWGGEPLLYPITRDNPEQLYSVVKDALSKADIVVLNGGSSKGKDDYALQVLEKVGEVLVYEVDHGPGKHTSFTLADGKPVLGIVGPAGGAELTAEWYLHPLVNLYLHQSDRAPAKLEVKLLADACCHVDFDVYLRVIVEKHNGCFVATPVDGFKERLNVSMVEANALLYLPGGKPYKAGETVQVEMRQPVEWIKNR